MAAQCEWHPSAEGVRVCESKLYVFEQARRWVAEELAIDVDESVNTFETTIRVLGGLLSAFILSPGDPVRRLFAGLRLPSKGALLAKL